MCKIEGCTNRDAGGGLCTEHFNHWLDSPECEVATKGGYGGLGKMKRYNSARADYARRTSAEIRVAKEIARCVR